MKRCFHPPILFAVLAFSLPADVGAQVASLVRDIHQEGPGNSGSLPSELLQLGGRVVFKTEGGGLWGTDGTSLGTDQILDVCFESCSGEVTYWEHSRDQLFFLAPALASPGGERAVWRTDGTVEGTRLIAGLGKGVFVPQLPPDLLTPPTLAGGELLFWASSIESGREQLWRSDGTEDGTVLLFDPPEEVRAGAAPFELGGETYFFARHSGPSIHLWKAGASAAPATDLFELSAVKDLPSHLVLLGGRVVFTAFGKGDTPLLWSADTTAAGTQRLSVFNGAGFVVAEAGLTVQGEEVFFVAVDSRGGEIWKSDGTVSGTKPLSSLPGSFSPTLSGQPLAVTPSHLVFGAADGFDPRRLWKTDRTTGATVQVHPGRLLVSVVHQIGGRAVYALYDDVRGSELWSSDGTAGGTRRLAIFGEPGCNIFQPLLVRVGQEVFFAPCDGERWVTNGTPEGTRAVSDFASVPGAEAAEFVPGSIVPHRSGYLMAGVDGFHGQELWASDSRTGRMSLVADLTNQVPFRITEALTAFGEDLLFFADDDDVWTASALDAQPAVVDLGPRSANGPAWIGSAGTIPVVVRNGGNELFQLNVASGTTTLLLERRGLGSIDQASAPLGDELLFASFDQGYQLWRTDGTPEGTIPVQSLLTGSSQVTHFTSVGDEVYFTLSRRRNSELWRSDGTAEGTGNVFTFDVDGAWSRPFFSPEATRVGEQVFFLVRDGDLSGLWMTDGSAEGTMPVLRLLLFETISSRTLAEFDGSLFLVGTDEEFQRTLWRVSESGEPAVIRRLGARPQFAPGQNPFLTEQDGLLFFVADDSFHGRELWASDGTPEGTRLVKDLAPGSRSSDPAELVSTSAGLFFTASDGAHGHELWVSDGTAEGTRLVHDIAPGGVSALPRELTAAGGHLYFSADDGVTGRELWALPLAGGGCEPTATSLCLQEDRFRLEIAWRDFQGGFGMGQAVPLTADTGTFWFFQPSNVETIVKVLDGRPLNQHHWVFFGALSNVEYLLTATDTQTGATRRYFNPLRRFASVGDTLAFEEGAPQGDLLRVVGEEFSGHRPGRVRDELDLAAVGEPCTPGGGRLCLAGGRFAVEASWVDFQGTEGVGHPVPITGDTGHFWFFDDANVEVVLKVLDGRGINGSFWVFYGALSNVEYTLTVTDTETGAVRIYSNPRGEFASVGDTLAFPP